ncbi:MAG: hypothetical protein IVW53_13150 [Chloroflexi bacterium]|nr:hypothetical protein [Chloroflexota bacterium]
MSTRATAQRTRPPGNQLALFEPPSDEPRTSVSPARARTDEALVPADGRVSGRAVAGRTTAQLPRRGRGSPGGVAGSAPAYDPLVAALAQLVRDRWAAEQADREKPVALGRVPSIMVTMAKQRSTVEETPA